MRTSERDVAGHVDRWVRDWESMMDAYLPGRGDLMMAGLQAAETALGRRPASVLDLGGGPGATAQKLLRKWPGCRVTVLDIDPVLLRLAAAVAPAAVIRRGDLAAPRWRSAAGGPYDVVLAVMTLHYFAERRVRELYAEVGQVLRPGGVLLVAEAMPEPSTVARRDLAGGLDQWERWWRTVASHPAMTPLLHVRAQVMAGRNSAEFVAGAAWHQAAARDAGYARSWTVWRRGEHILLAAQTHQSDEED